MSGIYDKISPITTDGRVVLVRKTDELSSATISAALKSTNDQLAQVQESHNTLVQVLKSVGQILPLVFPAVAVSSGDTVTLGSFRIPEGYTAEVLNAAVASLPVPQKANLTIFYSPLTFGSDPSGTGPTAILTTSTESSSGSTPYPKGELIFTVANSSKSKIIVECSVLLALK